MYKLIAIDLDGTMLNQYGIVTDYTKEVIKKVMEKGIEVIIASGRPIDSIKTIANEIESKKYFIAGNGAILYDIEKNENIYEKFLNKNKVLDIIKICEENSIFYNIYTEKEILAKTLKYNVLYYHKENLKKEESRKTHINIMQNIYEYIQEHDEKILKITICDKHQTIFNSILKKIKEVKEIEILDVIHMSRKMIKQGTEEVPIEYYCTEISAKNVDKWYAIEKLMKIMQISKEEVIAIGDNVNDKLMIENAGTGIAIQGGNPKVVEIADYVAKSNIEDGVAKALQEIILNK